MARHIEPQCFGDQGSESTRRESFEVKELGLCGAKASTGQIYHKTMGG